MADEHEYIAEPNCDNLDQVVKFEVERVAGGGHACIATEQCDEYASCALGPAELRSVAAKLIGIAEGLVARRKNPCPACAGKAEGGQGDSDA